MSIKDLFSFSKTERRGIIVLLFIILIQIIVLNSIEYFKNEKPIDFSEFEKEIDEFSKVSNVKDNQKLNSKAKNNNIQETFELFKFNPNSISDSDWKRLGFTDKQISVIKKYLSKGGRFYKKEDLAKIYVVSEEQFKRVENYIDIPSTSESQKGKAEEVLDLVLNPEYFEFDPNTISLKEWQKLGLSKKQGDVILNYISKGGRFYKKEDLKKIYSITEEQFKNLEPYIRIDEAKTVQSSSSNIIVEINSADSLQLIQVRGIGASYASRILKYRNKLGGFYNKEQLLEVYGLNQDKYNQIESSFRVDLGNIKKININQATVKELIKHPYLDYQLAKKIVEVRGFNGDFNSVEELIEFKLIEKEIFERIKYYLSVK